MTAEIYYFSGTGNSLIIARNIADKIDAKLLSVASLMSKKSIQSNSKVLGFIFPVYFAEYGGIPGIVQRFIEKFQFESQYIFAVVTHHGLPGLTITNFKHELEKKGASLACGFTVNLFVPFPLSLKLKKIFLRKDFDIFDPTLKELNKVPKIIQKSQKKVNFISEYILNNNYGHYESQGLLKRTLLAPHRVLMRYGYRKRYSNLAQQKNTPFEKLIHKSDNSFEVNENCTGCGICARVCPVNNIEIINNKPHWLHKCENCIACFNWCPNNSIQGEIVSYEIKFHHRQVKVKDLLDAKKTLI